MIEKGSWDDSDTLVVGVERYYNKEMRDRDWKWKPEYEKDAENKVEWRENRIHRYKDRRECSIGWKDEIKIKKIGSHQ